MMWIPYNLIALQLKSCMYYIWIIWLRIHPSQKRTVEISAELLFPETKRLFYCFSERPQIWSDRSKRERKELKELRVVLKVVQKIRTRMKRKRGRSASQGQRHHLWHAIVEERRRNQWRKRGAREHGKIHNRGRKLQGRPRRGPKMIRRQKW